MDEHLQVRIEWEGRSADVDAGIAPLILACWRNGIDTLLSCEENQPGVAWIMFAEPDDAKRFLDIAALPGQEMYQRIMGQTGTEDDWEFDIAPHDFNDVETEDDQGNIIAHHWHGPPDITFDVGVRFPAGDIPLILARMK